MKTALKIIAGLLSLVLLLIATAALLLTTMLHSDWLKTQIKDYTKSTTGRDLEIKGALHASLWPRLGIAVDDVSLSNLAGFDGQTFMHAHKLTIDAELIPLFHRQLIVNRATLRDAEINLQKNSRGESNWVFNSTSESTLKNKTPVPEAQSKQSKMEFNIVALSLIRTTVNYHDAKSNQKLSLANVNITAHDISNQKPFPIQGELTFVSNKNTKTGIKLNTVVDYNQADKKISFNNLDLRLKPSDFSEITITGNLVSDFNQSTLSISPLTLKMGDLKLTGDLSAQHHRENSVLKGQLSSNTFNLSKLLSSSKNSLHFKDKNALTQVQFTSDVEINGQKIALNNLNATIDGKSVSGQVDYTLSDSPRLGFALNTEELNLDRYLPSDSSSSSKNKNQKMALNNKKDSMVLDGSISVQQLNYSDYRLSSVKTTVKYSSKRLDLQNFSGSIFGGHTAGEIHINLSDTVPSFSIDQKMSGIHTDDLMHTLAGSSKITGLASLNISIKASGSSGDSIKRSLSGALTMNVNNGILSGTDIDYNIDQAISKYTKRTPTLSDRGQTPFTRLSGSASFSNGICNTPNIELLTPTLSVKSSGQLNLISNELDYKLSCRLLKSQKISTEYLGTKINADLSNYTIPAKVACTLQNPCVSVDLSGVLKILATEGVKAVAKTVIEKNLIKSNNPNVGKVLEQIFKP